MPNNFKKGFIPYLILFLIPFSGFASGKNPGNEKKLLDDARSYYMNGHYDLAKEKYLQLCEINPTSPDYHFETGLSYYHSEIDREKAIEWFEKALNLDSKISIPETYYYCGLASLYNEDIVKAKSYFTKFLKFIDPEKGNELTRTVNRLIEMCDNYESNQTLCDKNIICVNKQAGVNSIYSEYAPVLMKNKSTLIYTARKRGNTGGKKSADAVYYEDVYIALKNDSVWSHSLKIDSLLKYTSVPLNNKRHNAAVAFNQSETKLYLYQDADIYESVLENGKWTKPVRMNDNLNTREQEPSVFISPDEKYLLFVSTRSGGFGGRDIYLSEKNEKNEWGEAKNLGDIINTPYDDDAPFLTSDGKELYFASKGHNSMGGFDIFKSVKDENGYWSKPVNAGCPINSTADDIYYIQSDDNEIRILSSNRKGTTGGMDLFFIEKKKETEILVQIKEENTVFENQNSTDTDTKNEDTKNSDSKYFVFHPNAVNTTFQQNFGYNQTQVNKEETAFLGFMNYISQTINQKGNVEIIIESSASSVPTTTFTNNKSLAKKRGEQTRNMIEKLLIGAGFTIDQFTVSIASKVQGPAYNYDFDSNAESYQKYQYVILSVR
jgi:tetratricopeptide (TPR) repeat protein